jgi:hypothetical protein
VTRSAEISFKPLRTFFALWLCDAELVRIRLGEHENHDGGDRNVQANGKRQARNSAVHREAARSEKKNVVSTIGNATIEKDHVPGKMEGTPCAPGPSREKSCCRAVRGSRVADEKNGREREGQEHVRAMRFAIAMFDEIQSHAKPDRAQSVQERVEGRQKHPALGKISRSMTHVNPQERS